MMSGPHAHPLLIEHLGQVVRMDVLVPERESATAELGILRAEHRRADRLQRFDAVGRELPLMAPDVLHAESLEVLDRRGEADLLGDVHRPRLELVRRRLEGRVVGIDLHDHLAAAEERVHRVEQLEPSVESARRRRAQHLVAGDREEVHAELRDVHRVVRDELRAVHDHDRTNGVRGLGQPVDGGHRAEHVRLSGDGEDLRSLGDERLDLRRGRASSRPRSGRAA